MLLQPDPALAEVPGFATEQLESLARSIELKKQKLEADIHAYIRKKQRELAQYEQELLAQYRATDSANSTPMCPGSPESGLPSDPTSPPLQPAEPAAAASTKVEEKAKRPKHTRVHKREKELYGLVTPVFLPLLEAGEAAPAKKKDKEKKKRHKEKEDGSINSPPKSDPGAVSRDAESGQDHRNARSKNGERTEHVEDVNAEAAKEKRVSESGKKAKRPAARKSSLRHSSDRSRRKRVSLVIDDQIVLPADEFLEPPLTSPSETAASSGSNSTTSLDDAIDPRLMPNPKVHVHEHHDPVHHSIPLSTPLPSTSPTKHTGHTLPGSLSPQLPSLTSPRSTQPYYSPQTATETLLSPSPPSVKFDIPQYASAAPIYAIQPELAEAGGQDFSTYVGGISGSGADDVDQTGSLGYPSSLGASYMESYMQSRPLSVRMAAAEKAGLDEEEKELLMKEKSLPMDADLNVGRAEDVDDGMEVIGSMEGF